MKSNPRLSFPMGTTPPKVGPILLKTGPGYQEVLSAILESNEWVEVVDQGAYLRIQVPRRCQLERGLIERQLGGSFFFPMDLEAIMLSFQGRLTLTEDIALWE